MKESEKIVSSVQIEEKKRAKEKIQLFLISAASVIVFLGIWEAAVRLSWVNSQFVCSPSEAFMAFVDKLTQPNPDGAVLGVHIWESLKLALIGYVAAAVIGVPLGLLLGYYHTFDKLVNPIFEIIRPIPPVAITLRLSRPLSSFILSIIYSVCPMYPYTIPACMLEMVSFPKIDDGFLISTSGSFAVQSQSALAQIFIPGDVTPASKVPSPKIKSYVVAVPKSTTIHGPP